MTEKDNLSPLPPEKGFHVHRDLTTNMSSVDCQKERAIFGIESKVKSPTVQI